MKLSFWNWVHLLSPYIMATILRIEITSEGSFISWLATSYFLVSIVTMIPYMDSEVKTGRSFRTKHGKFDEYQTIKSDLTPGEMKSYIGLSHIVGLVLIIIYGIYCIFSNMGK
ncbi:hypothetical protein MCEGE10_02628 [Flavobacteriaceae bacterium]